MASRASPVAESLRPLVWWLCTPVKCVSVMTSCTVTAYIWPGASGGCGGGRGIGACGGGGGGGMCAGEGE